MSFISVTEPTLRGQTNGFAVLIDVYVKFLGGASTFTAVFNNTKDASWTLSVKKGFCGSGAGRQPLTFCHICPRPAGYSAAT